MSTGPRGRTGRHTARVDPRVSRAAHQPSTVGRAERRHLHKLLHAHFLGGTDHVDLQLAEAGLVVGQQEEHGGAGEGRFTLLSRACPPTTPRLPS